MIHITWLVCVYSDRMGGWVYLLGVNTYIWCEYSSLLCVFVVLLRGYMNSLFTFIECV